jgi:hypothetical protein
MNPDPDIETQLAANRAEAAELKAKAIACAPTWPAFLALPLSGQESLRRIAPDHPAELQRQHFARVNGHQPAAGPYAAGLGGGWLEFLAKPLPEQQRLRELNPAGVAQLERDHFAKVR